LREIRGSNERQDVLKMKINAAGLDVETIDEKNMKQFKGGKI